MKNQGILAAICLVVGIPLAAYGLANGAALFALAGLALVLAFWYLAWRWMTQAGKPQTPIKPAANAAWSMRDQAVGVPSPPTPSSSAGGGNEQDGASRRGEP